MTVKDGKYKCEICGNLIEVIENGDGDIYCCGEVMEILPLKWSD
ncbi:hypothetical protein C0584_00725 [Candidatus Parcubacteria bacterium]|nr:MAG: hypothetical protein C0584_00725 [Candidatus Parcubacteria bacterium]